jgi:pyrroline-5-carboxylate reductase
MRLGFIGAGSMASALARGLGEPALVSDVDPARASALAGEIGGEATASNAELADKADVVVLCHKPAQLGEVADEISGRAKVIASMVGATKLSALEGAYPETPIYRFIPNIPVEVGRGVLCYASGTLAADGPEDELLQLLGRVGTVVPVKEELIDPAMAIMSCGPAFVALVVEAMADAGAAHGFSAGQATRLVVETMAGTAAYLDAAGLRGRVATPGGLTEKGLQVLEERGLRDDFRAAVDLVVEKSA